MPPGCGHFLLPSKASSLRNKSKENKQILGAKDDVEICPSWLSSHPFLLGPPLWFAPPSHLVRAAFWAHPASAEQGGPKWPGCAELPPHRTSGLPEKPWSHGYFCPFMQGRPECFKLQCKTRLSYGKQKRGCQNMLVLLWAPAYLTNPPSLWNPTQALLCAKGTARCKCLFVLCSTKLLFSPHVFE